MPESEGMRQPDDRYRHLYGRHRYLHGHSRHLQGHSRHLQGHSRESGNPPPPLSGEGIEFFSALNPEAAAACAARQRRRQARNDLRKRRRRLLLIIGGAFFLPLVFNLLARIPASSADATRQEQASSPRAAAAAGPPPEFALIDGAGGLAMRLPARLSQVTAIGYHQAYNPRAYSLIPRGGYLQGEAIKEQVAQVVSRGKKPAFVMYARGRQSQATSSVDVVMPVGPPVLSPVSGTVRAAVPYKLYGRIDDVRLEIVPDGHPELVVAIVHISDIKVAEGQRVEAGRTPIAILRPLGIKSQIDEYTGLREDHLHIQVNPSTPVPPAPAGGR